MASGAVTVNTMPVALITGAAGGIGGATAERFIAGGWKVAAVDINAVEPVDRSAGTLLSITADLRSVAGSRRSTLRGCGPKGRAKTPPSRSGTM